MCKNKTLFRNIVNKYHPDFKSKSILKQVEKHPLIFNIEHLIELTMAEVGGYEFVDADHCDFSDGTECKTGSIRQSLYGQRKNTYSLEISNIVSPGGNIKEGDVRVVIYNPHTDSQTYYYIPQEDLTKIGINYHPTTGVGRIFASWNSKKNTIRKLDKYEVESFEDLAKFKMLDLVA
tara:strand:- start:69 stop:599 length:531 start_codon:yes stop_codon:yes gene_type:complete